MNAFFGKKYWAVVCILGITILFAGMLKLNYDFSLTGFVTAGKTIEQGIGNPLGQKRILFYCDYQDFYCFQANTIAQGIALKDKNVFFEFKQLPAENHPMAFQAAIASECAGQQQEFLKFHDVLMANYFSLSEEKILEIAQNTGGIELQSFNQCIVSQSAKNAVLEDMKSAESRKIFNVPAFVFNDERVSTTNSALLQSQLEQWILS